MLSKGDCVNCGNATHWAKNAVGGRDKLRYCEPCFRAYERTKARENERALKDWADKILKGGDDA